MVRLFWKPTHHDFVFNVIQILHVFSFVVCSAGLKGTREFQEHAKGFIIFKNNVFYHF